MPWLVLAFGAGAATVQLLPALPTPAILLLPALAALLAARWRPAIAALLGGFVWTVLGAMQLVACDWPCARDREVVELIGIVTAPATPREGRVEFDVRAVEATRVHARPINLRLSWYDASALPRPGQAWRITARLRCRNGLANPDAPDRELELLRQRIGATGYLVSGSPPHLLEDQPWRHPVQRLRAHIAADIAQHLPGSASSAGVLQGLSVGVRGGVPDALWESFAATGIAHLMAISGLHVTGCAVFALLLLRGVWRLPCVAQAPARTGIEMAIVVGVTAAYAALAGASVPTLRTLVMTGIVAWQRVLRRALPVHATLALAAFVLIAADPLAINSVGFWLSFVATAALLGVLAAGSGWLARLAAFLRAQAAILLLLTPVLAAAFGRLSLIAPIANAIAIPIFSLVLLPVILLATVLTALSSGLSAGIWQALAGLLDSAWPMLQTAGRLPWATWAPAAAPAAVVIATAAVSFIALLVPLNGLRAAAAVMLLALVLGRGARPDQGAWTLTVLDVGQGLAAVVRTHDHVLVFDSGPRWRDGPAAARVSLLPWLRAAGIRGIDRMIISHEDADHSGGAGLLQESLPIRTIVAGAGTRVAGASMPCRRGDRWDWDGIEFRILHPAGTAQGSDNDRSCALWIAGRGGSALLLADPEEAAEASMLSQRLAADVVLLPHHGSRTSSSPALVAAVGASLGIASTGFGNRWGMPDAGVVARWRAAGTTVLTTAEVGAIAAHFAAGPHGFAVAAHRLDRRRWWRRNST